MSRAIMLCQIAFVALFIVNPLTAGAPAEEPIDFRPIAGFLKLPEGMTLGPCSGVDIDSCGNVYVIQRRSTPILCFDSSPSWLSPSKQVLKPWNHFWSHAV